jgi:hypothetical protein
MLLKSRPETTGVLSEAEHEAYFVAKHRLARFQPSHDDLLSGLVDGAQDGGLDAAYIFANGFCLRDDTPLAALGRNAQLDLVLLQVKNSKGFGEAAIDKMIVTLPRLFDFNRDESQLAKSLNPKVIEVTRRFLDAYRALDMPNLRITTIFASLKAEHVHPNTVEKSDVLRSSLVKCFASCEPQVEFADAATVADHARRQQITSRDLVLAENYISTDTAGGYVAVVRLRDYEQFITDATGKLDAALFEANVRDYEGNTSVNDSIQHTLETADVEVDFWWLNNGVTIVADKVQPANKLLQLESPQIVNGLQTSHEIYKWAGSRPSNLDNRGLLVKVIQAKDSATRDRIIRATNSQTSLGPSALRATDKVQRQIEEFLHTKGLYYERRRHLYNNQGIPLNKLVSIDQMGQALLSSLVQLPHIARGSLARVFEDDTYGLLFAETHPIGVYAQAIKLQRHCENFLRSDQSTRGNVDDFAFHMSMLGAIFVTRKNKPTSADLASIHVLPTEAQLREMLKILREEFAAVAQLRREVLFDKVAKDGTVTNRVLERARQYLLTTRR